MSLISHTTFCLHIIVKFNKPHLAGQYVRYADGPTATQYLKVVHDALRLSVNYYNTAGDLLQQLNYSSADVAEYKCENVCEPKSKK